MLNFIVTLVNDDDDADDNAAADDAVYKSDLTTQLQFLVTDRFTDA